MDTGYLISAIEIEAQSLERSLRTHTRLSPFFTHDFIGERTAELRDAYLRLLKMKADYVTHTVPMLRAAGEALRLGNDEDRAWSEIFLGYAQDETDVEEDYGSKPGHQVWAHADMRALGATSSFIDALVHPSVGVYAGYLVEDAPHHPYGILGAKGVLEHLSIRMSDDLVAGVLASGIEDAKEGVRFFGDHGVLDDRPCSRWRPEPRTDQGPEETAPGPRGRLLDERLLPHHAARLSVICSDRLEPRGRRADARACGRDTRFAACAAGT